VFVAAYDGRLIALDAATGQKVWEKDTLIDRRASSATPSPARRASSRARW
jgi:outer membrane protein assembly factor BamB